jgi:hypothetical protein
MAADGNIPFSTKKLKALFDNAATLGAFHIFWGRLWSRFQNEPLQSIS